MLERDTRVRSTMMINTCGTSINSRDRGVLSSR